MDSGLVTRITEFLSMIGYEKDTIGQNIELADSIGYTSEDDALSIVAAGVVYGRDGVLEGKRFPVEPGSW